MFKMELNYKNSNKIEEKKYKNRLSKLPAQTLACACRQIFYFFKKIANANIVYEGNFATVCINAQGLRWQLSKKN